MACPTGFFTALFGKLLTIPIWVLVFVFNALFVFPRFWVWRLPPRLQHEQQQQDRNDDEWQRQQQDRRVVVWHPPPPPDVEMALQDNPTAAPAEPADLDHPAPWWRRWVADDAYPAVHFCVTAANAVTQGL